MIKPIRLRTVVASSILSILATGCTAEPAQPSGYTPVSDDVLFAQVKALPHLTNIANLYYEKKFGVSNGYTARIDTDGEVEPNTFMDDVFAILYQGRYQAGISISVTAPIKGHPDTPHLYLLPSSTLRERYGPQPGTGTPPANKPLPVAEGWVPPSKW